jgi:catechol 2,3-dioxygenase-like lactoylglutathione lyase family enzyme
MEGINFLLHVGMSVPSLEEARHSYVDLLGFSELGAGAFAKDDDIDRIMRLKEAAAKVAFLALGNFKIEMFEFDAPVQDRARNDRPVHLHGFTHLCLDVSDVVALHARLSAAGMAFHSAPVTRRVFAPSMAAIPSAMLSNCRRSSQPIQPARLPARRRPSLVVRTSALKKINLRHFRNGFM